MYVVAGRTDKVVVDVRVVASGISAVMVMSAFPSALVAIVLNINNFSSPYGISDVAVVSPFNAIPRVEVAVMVAFVVSSVVILVMTEFISNLSPGATATGAFIEIIIGDCTVVSVSDAPTAVVFVATANIFNSPLKYDGISKSTNPV